MSDPQYVSNSTGEVVDVDTVHKLAESLVAADDQLAEHRRSLEEAQKDRDTIQVRLLDLMPQNTSIPVGSRKVVRARGKRERATADQEYVAANAEQLEDLGLVRRVAKFEGLRKTEVDASRAVLVARGIDPDKIYPEPGYKPDVIEVV